MDKPDKLKRIGLLGGSFDPIHLGHIHMGLRAIEEFGLDKVFYITAKNSPFKVDKSMLSPEERHHLVEMALEDYPKLEASRIELDRPDKISYTYKTIEEFKQIYPQQQLFYLLGQDSFSHLNEWSNYQWIIDNISFIVFSRGNNFFKDEIDAFYIQDFDQSISSSKIKESLESGSLNDCSDIPEKIKPFLQDYYCKTNVFS